MTPKQSCQFKKRFSDKEWLCLQRFPKFTMKETLKTYNYHLESFETFKYRLNTLQVMSHILTHVWVQHNCGLSMCLLFLLDMNLAGCLFPRRTTRYNLLLGGFGSENVEALIRMNELKPLTGQLNKQQKQCSPQNNNSC